MKRYSLIVLAVVCLGLFASLGIMAARTNATSGHQKVSISRPAQLVSTRTRHTHDSTAAINMRRAISAIVHSSSAKNHTTTWLIFADGHVKLLRRLPKPTAKVLDDQAPPPAGLYYGSLCKQDELGVGSLNSGETVVEVFGVAKGTGAASGDFAGNALGVDDSTFLTKGLQYATSENEALVSLYNDTDLNNLPYSGYWNLLYTPGPSGCT